jgi:hypothetical protein
LNRLYRNGFIRRGARSGPRGIRWVSTYWGELASATITADMSGEHAGWLRLQGDFDEWIILVARPRRRPPGARWFRSRQAWGRQVAYRSQFSDPDNRAHLGKERIKARLIADLDPDEWDLPPKPKWMRWSTYNRYVERYDNYESILDYGTLALVSKLGKNFF